MRPRAAPVAALLVVTLALVMVATGPATAVGEDPGLGQQWGLARIGAPAAWTRTVGTGTPIAVIDTGIDLGHEDLRSQVAAAMTCVGTGGDPGRCRRDGEDIEGHGTHVAGIAAAAANGVGVSGVAPGARLVAVRVFSADAGEVTASSEDINAAIAWVLANVAGRGVINLSVGADFLVTSLFGAGFGEGIQRAWAAGWVPVLASGNSSGLLSLGSSNYGNLDALVVGATGPEDRLASYSSPIGNAKWGIVAPGGDATSCPARPERCVLSTYRGNRYGYLQGTSMATPHVSGAVALLMSAGLSNARAVARLLETADRSVACGATCAGRLDVSRATADLPPLAPPAVPPAPVTTSAPPTPPSTLAPAAANSRPRAPATSGPQPTGPAPAAELAPEPGPGLVAGAPEAGSEPVPVAVADPLPPAPRGLPPAPVAAAVLALLGVVGGALVLRPWRATG